MGRWISSRAARSACTAPPGGSTSTRGGRGDRASSPTSTATTCAPGSRRYFCAAPSLPFLKKRLGPGADAVAVPYGEPFRLGDVTLSFHPRATCSGPRRSGWKPGARSGSCPATTSARRIRPARRSRWCPATCSSPRPRSACPSTAGTSPAAWSSRSWPGGTATGRPGMASVLFCYAMGKAQRILGELARLTDRHGPRARRGGEPDRAVPGGRRVPAAHPAGGGERRGESFAGELVLAPPGAGGSTWMRRFKDRETAFASGWMRVRGTRRRKGFDRGFVLSDHADWPALLRTIEETGARRVLVTHGYADELAAVPEGARAGGRRHSPRRTRARRTCRHEALRRAVRGAGPHDVHQPQGRRAGRVLLRGAARRTPPGPSSS